MGYKLTAEEKARRAARRAAIVNPYKPGDVLVCCWGYEQTNADFWRVEAVTPKGVKLRGLRSVETEREPRAMSGHAVPDLEAPPFDKVRTARLVPPHGSEEPQAKLGTYQYAHRWDGHPVGVSWYG